MALLHRIATFICGIAIPALTLGDPHQSRTGLPAIVDPPDNAFTVEKAALGERLFFDERLSASGTISCASCHQPGRAFSDGLEKSIGIAGQTGTRNAPSLLNAAFMTTQFWDGRRSSLEAQVLDPFLNSKEHGLTSTAQLRSTIERDPTYVAMFATAFGGGRGTISEHSISKALACYVRSLARGGSPFDRYYYEGDHQALNSSARRGLALFVGRAQCASCHQIGPSNATFSDQQFHGLHIGIWRIENRLPDITLRVVAARKNEQSIDSSALGDPDLAELGRFLVTLEPTDIGQFRTPSLRNVALTAPYMHDGSVPTLAQAIDQELYYRSTQGNRPLILTPTEKQDLLQFLRSLTSDATGTTHTTDTAAFLGQEPLKR